MRGNVNLSGAETVNGDFQNDTWTVQPSCQDAAANGSGGAGFGPDGAYMIPGPYPDGTVLSDGTDYITNLQIEPDKFQGPGSYTQIAGGIQVGGQEQGYYDFSLAGTAEAVVNEDGSGSLEFSAVPAKTAPCQMLSGRSPGPAAAPDTRKKMNRAPRHRCDAGRDSLRQRAAVPST